MDAASNGIKKKSRIAYRRKRLKSDYIFSQEDINRVMYALPFVDIISVFVPLKKSGPDYVGRCPFCRIITQNDKHFRVSENKRLYKCFQCGAGGHNAVSFLMRYYNAPFDKVFCFLSKKYVFKNTNRYWLVKPNRIRSMERKTNTDDNLPF